MPEDAFIHPISAKGFLRYAKYNEKIDFINIEKDPHLNVLNKIDIPLFMRWGSNDDMIIKSADIYSDEVRKIIANKQADISYIEGADHSYRDKEETLAKQIVDFVLRAKKE